MYPAGVANVHARTISLATGIAIRVVESGPAAGAPVLLLHGWGGSAYMFRGGIDRLAAQGFRVLAPDLRGFGLSDKPTAAGSYTVAAFMADVLALLNALDLPRVVLVGQSLGGGVALRCAIMHPERVAALALVNPVGLSPLPYLGLIRLLPQSVLDALGPRAVPRWVTEFVLRRLAYADPRKVSEADVDEYWAPSQFAGYAHALRATMSDFDWSPVGAAELASLAPRTLVVLGDGDRLVSPEAAAKAAAAIPTAQVVALPGGHCVHEEQADLVYPLIAKLAQKSKNQSS